MANVYFTTIDKFINSASFSTNKAEKIGIIAINEQEFTAIRDVVKSHYPKSIIVFMSTIKSIDTNLDKVIAFNMLSFQKQLYEVVDYFKHEWQDIKKEIIIIDCYVNSTWDSEPIPIDPTIILSDSEVAEFSKLVSETPLRPTPNYPLGTSYTDPKPNYLETTCCHIPNTPNYIAETEKHLQNSLNNAELLFRDILDNEVKKFSHARSSYYPNMKLSPAMSPPMSPRPLEPTYWCPQPPKHVRFDTPNKPAIVPPAQTHEEKEFAWFELCDFIRKELCSEVISSKTEHFENFVRYGMRKFDVRIKK